LRHAHDIVTRTFLDRPGLLQRLQVGNQRLLVVGRQL
jgi:hypothetical protein